MSDVVHDSLGGESTILNKNFKKVIKRLHLRDKSAAPLKSTSRVSICIYRAVSFTYDKMVDLNHVKVERVTL